MNTRSTRLVTAVTTALTCLLMTQSPASAVTHTSDITAGTSVSAKTGSTTFIWDLGPSATTGCPAGTADADITATAISITALSIPATFVVNGVTYVQVRTLSPATFQSPGTISGTAISSLRVGVMTQYFAQGTTPCTTTGTPVCTLRATPHLAGTLTGISTSHTGHVAAPSALVSAGGACGVPFSTYIGATLTITSLTFHLT